jgi:hypothetical protein
MNIKSCLVLSVVLSLISCKSQQQNYDDFKGRIITIGKGGGITGAYDEYSILENGQLFHYNTLTKQRVNSGKMESNITNQIFHNYELLKIREKQVNLPGNMNYFVQINDKGKTVRSLWSDMDSADSQLVLFYKFAMNYIQKPVK